MTVLTLDYFALFSICLMGAMSPGPSLFVILGVASQRGVRAGLVASWSHALGVALWASISVFTWYLFVGNTQDDFGGAVHIVSGLACFYLIYMSITMLRQAFTIKGTQDRQYEEPQKLSEAKPTNQQKDRESSTIIEQKHTAVRAGLSIALANPKLLVFFSAIYPQVLPRNYSSASLIMAIIIPFVVDGFWYQNVTIFAEKAGILKLVNRYQKLTALITAIILILLAARTLFSSLLMIL